MGRSGAIIGGARGTVRCDWATAALLRDNVLHWLEGGVVSGGYPAIHALAERASIDSPEPIDAASLLNELDRALPLLRAVPGARAAVSSATHARASGHREHTGQNNTQLARSGAWSAPLTIAPDAPLASAFDHLVGLVLHVADRPTGRLRP